MVASDSMPTQIDDLPLMHFIDSARASAERIARGVVARRTDLAARTGLTGRALNDALALELVDEAAEKSALIATGLSLPFSVPPFGPITSTLLAASGSTLWGMINEMELCYALAFAYQVSIPAAKLRLISFYLVNLTDYEDLQAIALSMGVRVTMRKAVEKSIAVGLTRAFGYTPGMMARMMGRATAPWYVRATGFLGVPVLAVLAWRSTQAVGARAAAYFTDELTPKFGSGDHDTGASRAPAAS